MTLKGILFDKDGTLVDFDATWGTACHAVLHRVCAGDAGRMAAIAEAMHFRLADRRFLPSSPMIAGSTADYSHAWAEVLGRANDAALMGEMDRLFQEEALAALVPIGAPHDIFPLLRACGLSLGLATNDAEASARSQLARLGVLDDLDFIAGYDSGYGGKPAPGMVQAFIDAIGAAPGEVALVGDSLHDLEAARAAGARAIAVLSGPATRADLEAHADHVIGSIEGLLPLLEAEFALARPDAGRGA